MRSFVPVIAAFLTLLLAATAGADTVSTNDLPGRIQQQYETLRGFKADFTQTLTNAASGQQDTRTGAMAVLQPGLVRWEAKENDPEVFVIGESEVWNYFPEEELAIRYPKEEVMEASRTMVRLMSGQARLNEDFRVADQGLDNGRIKLRLTPLEPEPTLVLAYLWVEPESALIAKILLVDFYGNGNEVELRNLRLNPLLTPEQFQFTPPEGVEVQDNLLPPVPDSPTPEG
jgi:outer membrane lipoprotein carrier protein